MVALINIFQDDEATGTLSMLLWYNGPKVAWCILFISQPINHTGISWLQRNF